MQALNDVIARYNNSTTARNTAVEGNEKMAMQFLVSQSDEFRQMLEALWRTYVQGQGEPNERSGIGQAVAQMRRPAQQWVGHGVLAMTQVKQTLGTAFK